MIKSIDTADNHMPFIGHAYALKKDVLGFLGSQTSKHGDRFVYYVGIEPHLFLNDPLDVESVLTSTCFAKTGARAYRNLKLVLGEGVATSEGETWKLQRKTLQPAFHYSSIEAMVDRIVLKSSLFLANMPEYAIDIKQKMLEITMSIISSVLMSTDIDNHIKKTIEALSTIQICLTKRILYPLDIPLWVPTLTNLSLKRALNTFDEIIQVILANRNSLEEAPKDMLQLLIETYGNSNKSLIKDQIITMFIAGHETTANALTWALYTLSRDFELQEQLFNEYSEFSREFEYITIKNISRLPILKSVFNETLRLYPPVWMIIRYCIQDVDINGLTIPKGTTVTMSPYTLQRNPKIWENPDQFSSIRFKNPLSDVQKKSYIPFGLGPRQCIGKDLAQIESLIVLSKLLSNYVVFSENNTLIEPEPKVTLQPKKTVYLNFKRRA